MTQQELADSIGVSFQTVSKWETGVNMPDITLLPLLADYFHVSTDQLLGLKPLDGESYIPERTATKDFWNQKLEYLLRTRKNGWNDDYARFLISQVWKNLNAAASMSTAWIIRSYADMRGWKKSGGQSLQCRDGIMPWQSGPHI